MFRCGPIFVLFAAPALLLFAGCAPESLQNPSDIIIPTQCQTTAALTLYERRIEPLVNGTNVSSCNQCHLSGMDLSMYVRETPCHTMGCLIENDLVDLQDPASSVVLQQILKAEPTSELITGEVIQNEHDAFLEWIEHSADCHNTACASLKNPCGAPGPSGTPEPGTLTPLGTCDEDSLIDLFDERVFQWRLRCHGCHENCDKDKAIAPCWLVYSFDKDDPGGRRNAAMLTMYNLIGLGAVDTGQPLQSTMLLKPLSEKLGGIAHGGGAKMLSVADSAYQDFIVWLEHYGACYEGEIIEKPTVFIDLPKYGQKYAWDEAIWLQGMAEDPQDGRLPDTGLIWSLHDTGEILGMGEWLYLDPLPPGKPILTLTAIDSDGHMATRSTRIRIKAPPEPEPPPEEAASDSESSE